MNFRNIIKIINPQPRAGALEISDIDLKFAQAQDNRLASFSVKLAADVVKDGKIVDREKFREALRVLYRQIAGKEKREIYVVVNLPDNNIYFQTFVLPSLGGENFEETVELNLKMASPIDYAAAHIGWQMSEQAKSGELNKADQVEILGAFIQSSIIDEIEEALSREKFIPIVTEFNALSLTRVALELGADILREKNYILIYFSNNGVSFNLIRKGNLYFNHFVAWAAAYADEREIPKEAFEKLIIEELKKVLSFYKTRWTEPIEKIILVMPSKEIEDNISRIISENLSFASAPLRLKKFSNVAAIWFPVLGSVLRGTVPWSLDRDINLVHSTTKEKLFQYKLIHFFKLWQKIILSFLGAMLLIFIGVDLFLNQAVEKKEDGFLKVGANSSEEQEKNKVVDQIQKINSRIDWALAAQNKRTIITPFLAKIKLLGDGAGIQIQRIFVQSWNAPIFISGLAPTSDAAVAFKNKLASDGGFSNIELPITKITPASGGVNFAVSFTLK